MGLPMGVGQQYNKAGVILSNLTYSSGFQSDLLVPVQSPQEPRKSDQLMATIDHLNHKGHEQTVFLASQGVKKAEAFSNKKSLSPCYTTS